MGERLELVEISLKRFYQDSLRQCGHPDARLLKVPDDNTIFFVLNSCLVHILAHLFAERTPLLVMLLSFSHYLLRGMRVATLALLRALVAIVSLSSVGGAIQCIAKVDGLISLARTLLHLLELQPILQSADSVHIFYY